MPTTKQEWIEHTFNKQNLKQVTLSHKYFEECVFDDCDFSEAELKHCKFIDCEFINCNLTLSKLDYSKFNSVKFLNCKIIGVNWTQAIWSSIGISYPLHFEKCILNDASFFGLPLQEAVFMECKIHNAAFGEANCESANFSYSDLQETSFHRTNLSYANFEGAINYNIDVLNCHIKGAKFSLPEAVQLLNGLDIEII